MDLISGSINPSPKVRQKENKKNFHHSFTPTPKGNLLEILLTGMKGIKCTPFRVGEKWI